MAKSKPSVSGLRDFAVNAVKQRRAYPSCETCRRFPQAKEDIAEFVRAQSEGDPDFRGIPLAASAGRPSLLLWLQQKYDYDLTGHSLRRHVHLCLTAQNA